MDTKEISETSKNVVVRGEGRETSRKMLCREKRVAKTEKRPQLQKEATRTSYFFAAVNNCLYLFNIEFLPPSGLATCYNEWWNDIWLNEGFATYMELISLNITYPELQFVSHNFVSHTICPKKSLI